MSAKTPASALDALSTPSHAGADVKADTRAQDAAPEDPLSLILHKLGRLETRLAKVEQQPAAALDAPAALAAVRGGRATDEDDDDDGAPSFKDIITQAIKNDSG